MKHTIAGFMVAAAFIALPLAASAQTTDVQAQINALLEQIKTLQAKLTDLLQQVQHSTPMPAPDSVAKSYPHRVCALISRSLSQGMQGDDVSGLQEFLNQKGYLSAGATGYYGALTAKAVSQWQYSEGLSPVGIFGPMSREHIKVWCGGNSSQDFQASPQSGNAPLAVNFTYLPSEADGQYYISYGDGQSELMTIQQIYCIKAPCISPAKADHTYTANGVYTATVSRYIACLHSNPRCMIAEPPPLATLTIKVGKSEACRPINYMPILCQGGVAPTPQKDQNGCITGYKCADQKYDPSADARCKSWYDGCNSCSRETATSPAMCTLRACFEGFTTTSAYCTAYFDDSMSKPPVISSFSGPTTLAVNQSGTWSIQASDPENQTLSYSVTWGDENRSAMPMMGAAMDLSFVQTTTFTHSYAYAGTYTIAIVVKDSAGQSARTSTTVRIGSDGVICTADAMLCPNGTYVGRTGPNCQFVCPQ